MAFALKPGEPVRKGLRRIARKQLKKVRTLLTAPSESAIHEARKCVKKLRALLRLARPHIGNRCYRSWNTVLRDAARPLSAVRDARIIVDSHEKLVQHSAHVSQQAFADVRAKLETDRDTARQEMLGDHTAISATLDAVDRASKQLRDWTDVPNRWMAIGDGLKQQFRQARYARSVAEAEPTDVNLHEWRKQVKFLRYQLQILEPVSPAQMASLVDQVDRLGELLGDDHDLVVLRKKLTDAPERFGTDAVETLGTLIERRRSELQHEARELGERLLADRPKDFARRLKEYWKAWRKSEEKLSPVP